MATITSLGTGDSGAVSRNTINTNFTNLNSDKLETSVLDTDVALTANSDAKVATQRAVKTYVDNATGVVTTEITTGSTHSLTTDGTTKVVVFAKGNAVGNSNFNIDVLLKYDGTTKDTVAVAFENTYASAFSLMYTETPAAGTANITVESTQSLANVVIMVIKIS